MPKSSISDSRCQWLESTSSTKACPDKLGSLARENNIWYVADPGESAGKLSTGVIRPAPQPQRPAWGRQDKYTKSRNPAGDSNRYSYIQDCTDEIRRDVPLRFAHNPTSTMSERKAFLPQTNCGRQQSPLRPIHSASAATRRQ